MLWVFIRMMMYVIFTLTGKKHIRQRDFNKRIVPLSPRIFIKQKARKVFFLYYQCVFFLKNQFQQGYNGYQFIYLNELRTGKY
jgi:hypothetical protein